MSGGPHQLLQETDGLTTHGAPAAASQPPAQTGTASERPGARPLIEAAPNLTDIGADPSEPALQRRKAAGQQVEPLLHLTHISAQLGEVGADGAQGRDYRGRRFDPVDHDASVSAAGQNRRASIAFRNEIAPVRDWRVVRSSSD